MSGPGAGPTERSAGPADRSAGRPVQPAELPYPPADDTDVPRWLADLGLPGLVDVHVHFLPERMLRKVWDYFDHAPEHYGTE